MGRPAGVTASAVVAILGSALVLLTGGIMVMGLMLSRPAKAPGLGAVIVVVAVVFAAFAAFGAWTGIALLRLRPWARISTLVFAGFMSPVSAIAVIGISVIPATLMQDGQQQGSFSAMRPFMAGMYAIPLAIGVWWLVYFNRRDIKSAFAAPYEPGGPPLRPLSISIIGWMSVVGGAFSIPLALTQVPAFVAGFVVTGWAAALIYVGFGAVSLYLGWAVLKLRELGRRLMIAWYGLAIAHAVYMSLVPSVRVRLADMQRAMPFLAPATAPDFQSSMMIAMMLFGVAVGAVIIWFLVKERSRFSSSPS